MGKPHHEIIGFHPTFDLSAVIDSLLNDFRDRMAWSTPHDRRLQAAAELVYIEHFGFPGVPPVGEFLNDGLNVALDYFLGKVRPEDQREERWYQPLRDGLMLGMLAERWDDVTRLCGWVRSDRVPEYCGPIDPAIPQIYVLLAGALRETPMEGLDAVEESIARRRTKVPRLLLKAWRAVRVSEQATFDDAIHQSLQRFASEPALPPDDTYVGERIARPETAVCLAAMRLGLKFPALPAELAARVVTRKSLGLND